MPIKKRPLKTSASEEKKAEEKIVKKKLVITENSPVKIEAPDQKKLIDSIEDIDQQKKQEENKKSYKKIIILSIILILILSIGFGYNYLSSTLNKIIEKTDKTTLYDQLQMLIKGSDEKLKGEPNDRINILLLGMGGGDHAGGTLTDTIMIASIKPSTKQIALISLPRDLIVPIYPNDKKNWYYNKRINNAYEIGGIELAQEKVAQVTGLKIHYYLLLDFAGFIKIIDDIGKVNVDVENGFSGLYHITDSGGTCKNAAGGPTYLSADDGPYCIFTFEKGSQIMDGNTALMFSRIRKVVKNKESEEFEGNDFARAKRQQIILEAFRSKILSTSTLANPIKITKVINDLGDHVKTNMQLWEMAKIATLAQDLSKDNIINQVIDEEQGFLTMDSEYNLYPTLGLNNFTDIQKTCKNIFKAKIAAINANSNTNEAAVEDAKILILNGTTTPGLAATWQEKLTALDFQVSEIANAPEGNYPDTLIFDVTEKNPNTLNSLTKELSAKLGSSELFTNLNNTNQATDFIIILGDDQL